MSCPPIVALAVEEVSFEFSYRSEVYTIHASPASNPQRDIDGIVVAQDVTNRRRNERAQRFLVEASILLADSFDYRASLAKVAKLTVPDQADWCLVCLRDGDQFRWHSVAHADPALAAKLRANLQAAGPIPSGITRLLSATEPTKFSVLTKNQLEQLATTGTFGEAFGEMAPRSAIFAPLVGHGRPHGGIIFIASATHAGGSGRRFRKSDLEVAAGLARLAGMAIENTLLLEESARHELRLEDFIERLLVAQEEERRQIAYDIHDQLAQVATSAYQHVQALAHLYHPRSASTRAALGQALTLSRNTMREVRQLIAGLRPTMLDELGLSAAVDRLLDDLRSEGWEIDYENRLGNNRLPAGLEMTLFRVAQEALSNVWKHAGKTRIRVSLHRSRSFACLEVRDWGRGFSAQALPPSTSLGTHIGLEEMQERLALVGGTCQVISRAGEGTRVVAKAPLNSSEEPFAR